MNANTKGDGDQRPRGCNVRMTFNFAVGAVAIVAALALGYLAYSYLWG